MTALAKLKSRGIVVSQSVASVYVAMAGLQSVEVTGEKSTAQDTTTLDGPVHRTKDPDGYVDPPSIKLAGFFDPDHPTYSAMKTVINAPVATNFKVTYTDDTPTSDIYSVVSIGLDKKGEQGKHIMADISLESSGDPS